MRPDKQRAISPALSSACKFMWTVLVFDEDFDKENTCEITVHTTPAMLPTVIKSCPSIDDFKPLAEYQSQTPETFFEGEKVLYFHDTTVKAWCPIEQHARLHFFQTDSSPESRKQPSPPECHGLENEQRQQICEEGRVEVFVSSNKLILFSHKSNTGIEIPYPAISLHAIKNFKHLERPDDSASKFHGVYMQLEFSGDSGADDDESYDPIELTLVPYQGVAQVVATPDGPSIDPLNSERATAMFSQISACSDLHPDQYQEEDDEEDYGDRIVFEGEALEGLPGAFLGNTDGSLPPPMPGSSGWITAENVHEHFDADGNYIYPEENGVSGELGEGAGRVRARDEIDGDGDDSDSKRPRTD